MVASGAVHESGERLFAEQALPTHPLLRGVLLASSEAQPSDVEPTQRFSARQTTCPHTARS